MKEVGLQLYSIRDVFGMNEENVRDGFRRLADFGYTQAEPAGIPIDPAVFARFAKEAGVKIVSTHYDSREIFEDTERAMRVHDLLGSRYIGIGGYSMNTVDEVTEFIEKANRVSEIMGREGFKFLYHNHSHEFIPMEDGRTIYERLLTELDPRNTVLELDCYWAQNAGIDPAAFLREHGDRIRLIHLKDMAVRRNAETGHAESFITEVGHGNMNYKGIVQAADEVNIEYYIVEQDANWMDGDPMKAVGSSCRYILSTLRAEPATNRCRV